MSHLPAGLVDVERFLCAFDRAQRCPYCHEELEQDRAPLAACTACKTLLHATCALQHGGCTTSGCARAAAGVPHRETPRGRPVAPVRVAPLVGVVALCGAGAWFLGLQLAALFPATPPPPVVITVSPPPPPPPPPQPVVSLQVERVEVSSGALVLGGRVLVEGVAERPRTLAVVVGHQRAELTWVQGTANPWIGQFSARLSRSPGSHTIGVEAWLDGIVSRQSLQIDVPGRAVQPTPPAPIVCSIGSAPAAAPVALHAPEVTDNDTVLIRGRVLGVPSARIELSVDQGDRFVWEAQQPGEFQGAVTVSGRGRHTIQVAVTLPDGRTGSASCQVVRR